jgi:hypothetical protein
VWHASYFVSAAAVAGAAAVGLLCASLPFVLVAMWFGCTKRKKFVWLCGRILYYSFVGIGLPPAVAVLIAVFPLSVPSWFIIRGDGDD